MSLSEETSLDEEVWAHLVTLVNAAHSLDRRHYLKVSQKSVSELDRAAQKKLGLCVWYLLRRVLRGFTGGQAPTDSELHSVSEVYGERFSSAVPGTKGQLEETFRYVFERPQAERAVSAGEALDVTTEEDVRAETTKPRTVNSSLMPVVTRHPANLNRSGGLRLAY